MSNDNPPADHVYDDDSSGDAGDEPNPTGNPLEENLKSTVTWKRGLFMAISFALMGVALFAGSVLVILGFFWVLFSGEVNKEIRGAGQSIATWLYEAARFLTFNTEERPFPLGGQWPSSDG